MPPAISTTSSPTAKIRFDRAGVEQIEQIGEREEVVASQATAPTHMMTRTTTSQVSVGWARKSLGRTYA